MNENENLKENIGEQDELKIFNEKMKKRSRKWAIIVAIEMIILIILGINIYDEYISNNTVRFS